MVTICALASFFGAFTQTRAVAYYSGCQITLHHWDTSRLEQQSYRQRRQAATVGGAHATLLLVHFL